MIASGLGVKPSFARQADGKILLVGHDCTITVVNAISGVILSHYPLEGAFFEFIECEELGHIVIHELGAARIDKTGRRVWNVSTDIVVDWKVTGNELQLFEIDGTSHYQGRVVDTISGEHRKF